MKIYEVVFNGKQYAELEKMLISDRARKLAMNQLINGYELFSDMINYICMAVTDGWSTYEIVLQESDDQLAFLRFLTKQVFPDDDDYFVRQIGKRFHCKKDFAFKIDLKF